MRPTTKRLARIAGLGVGVLAVACALLWVWLSETRGPLIQGKPVAYWTRQLSLSPTDQDAIDALASDNAVAMPALLQQLLLPDSRISDAVKGLWRRLPAAIQARVPKPTTRAELRAQAGYALTRVYRTKALRDRNKQSELLGIATPRDDASSATIRME